LPPQPPPRITAGQIRQADCQPHPTDL
jgi:hypothetical protein